MKYATLAIMAMMAVNTSGTVFAHNHTKADRQQGVYNATFAICQKITKGNGTKPGIGPNRRCSGLVTSS